MSDPVSPAEMETASDLIRLIGERLTPLYLLAPDVMPGTMRIKIAQQVYERLRAGDADAAKTLVAFLWPTDGPPDGWWETDLARLCVAVGVEPSGDRKR